MKLVFLAMLCLGWRITVPRLMQERSQDSDSFLVIQKNSIVFSWSFSEEKKKKQQKTKLVMPAAKQYVSRERNHCLVPAVQNDNCRHDCFLLVASGHRCTE